MRYICVSVIHDIIYKEIDLSLYIFNGVRPRNPNCAFLERFSFIYISITYMLQRKVDYFFMNEPDCIENHFLQPMKIVFVAAINDCNCCLSFFYERDVERTHPEYTCVNALSITISIQQILNVYVSYYIF